MHCVWCFGTVLQCAICACVVRDDAGLFGQHNDTRWWVVGVVFSKTG